MSMSRTICGRLQSQLLKPLCKSASPPKLFLLHHIKSVNGNWQQDIVRSFRSSAKWNNSIQATPFENMIVGGRVPPNNVMKAVLFTGAFTVGTFMGATIMEYENSRRMMLDKLHQAKFAWLRRKKLASNKFEEYRNDLSQFWNELSPGEKVFTPLCALNVLVFCLWRVPSMRNIMINYFTSNPAARAICWPMFLSTFSHYSAFHLGANMYVLHSFSNAAVLSMGKEQFLAVYLTAGVIASLTSVVYKAMISQAGLSLGASGAIMAILAYVCTKYPDTRLSILFLPTLTFSAGTAIKVIMGIDLAGCVMGWKFFDHAAHLGGASFGVLWGYFGNELWQKRLPFLSFYHDLRKTK